jgi:hypothetical protein
LEEYFNSKNLIEEEEDLTEDTEEEESMDIYPTEMSYQSSRQAPNNVTPPPPLLPSTLFLTPSRPIQTIFPPQILIVDR